MNFDPNVDCADDLDLCVHRAAAAEAPFATLCDMFDHAVATAPERVALRHLGVALTYRELGCAVEALAGHLATLAAPGEVVALLLPNSIAFNIAYFAALKALVTPALLNPSYAAMQLPALRRYVSPRAVVCVPATQASVARLAADSGASVVCLGRDLTVSGLVAEAAPSVGWPAMPRDPGALLFSGGTTGVPKVIEYTHDRLVAAVDRMHYIWPTRSDGEVFLPVAPFTHIYGFLQGVLVPLSARGESVIPERFQPEHIVELLARYRVSFFGGGSPAIYAGMLAAGNLDGADLSALRTCPGGGARFPVELTERWWGATGLNIYDSYGMSEIAPISGATVLEFRQGSVGKPVPGNEVQVVDLDTGRCVLSPGEKGEFRVRGPHMMTGYRTQPEKTVETMRDGFLYTGDIGYLDEDGFLFITERKKDGVFVRRSNLFPCDVEEMIHAHSRVGVGGIVGRPGTRSERHRVMR